MIRSLSVGVLLLLLSVGALLFQSAQRGDAPSRLPAEARKPAAQAPAPLPPDANLPEKGEPQPRLELGLDSSKGLAPDSEITLDSDTESSSDTEKPDQREPQVISQAILAPPALVRSVEVEEEVAVEVVVETPFEPHTAYTLKPIFSFSRIDATDNVTGGHATLGSGVNYGAELSFEQFWSNTFQTSLGFSGEVENYSTTDPSRSLNNSSLFLGDFDLGAEWGKAHSSQFLAHAGMELSPFVRGSSLAANTIDTLAIPYLGVAGDFPLYRKGMLSLTASERFDYLLPGSASTYNVQSGYSFTTTLAFTQELPSTSKSIGADLFVRYVSQNTTITNQSDLELGIHFNFSFDILSR